MEDERLTVLRLLEERKITADEAAELLRAIEAPPRASGAAGRASGSGDGADPLGCGWDDPRRPRGRSSGPGAASAAGMQAAVAEQVSDAVERLVDRFGALPWLGSGFRFEETVEGEIEAVEAAVLDVAARSGRVAIRATDEPRRVRVVLHKTVRAASEGEARSRAGSLGRASVEGDRVVVACDGGWGSWGWGGRVAVELLLPRAVCWSGDVETSNGRIDIAGLTCGALNVASSNGRLQLSDCRCSDLVARTSNGRITARGLGGRARLRTSNGSIEVELEPLEGDNAVTLETSNGPICVGGPALGVGWDVDAQTHVGRIHSSLPGVAVDSRDAGATGWGHGRAWGHAHARGQTPSFAAQPRRVRCETRTSNGSITINAV